MFSERRGPNAPMTQSCGDVTARQNFTTLMSGGRHRETFEPPSFAAETAHGRYHCEHPHTKRRGLEIKLHLFLNLALRYWWWARILQSAQQLATGSTVRRSNPGIGKILPHSFRPILGPNQPRVKKSTGSVSQVKRTGCAVDNQTPSGAEVKKRVELNFYFSGPS